MKKILFLVSLVPLLSFLFASQALAAEVRQGGQVEVRAGEVVDDDLYIAGTSVSIAGTVNGDVVAAGSAVTVSGRVRGNLFVAGQNVIVSGTVEGGVFAAGQTVVVSGGVTPTARIAAQTLVVQGQIGRDLLAAGQGIRLEREGAVGQDMFLAAQDGQIMGSVGRKVGGNAQALAIAGKAGDVDVETENLTLMSGAIVNSLTYTSAREARIDSGAVVTGTLTRLAPPERLERREAGPAGAFLSRLFWFLGTLVAGAVMLLLFPASVVWPAEALGNKPWQSLGWGAVVFVVTPVAVLFALITVVGIPIGLLVLFAYAAVMFLSQVFVGLFIGRLILQGRKSEGIGPLLGALALGLLVLTIGLALVGLIPYLGGFITLAVLVFGLGGAWLAAGRARLGPGQREVAAS